MKSKNVLVLVLIAIVIVVIVVFLKPKPEPTPEPIPDPSTVDILHIPGKYQERKNTKVFHHYGSEGQPVSLHDNDVVKITVPQDGLYKIIAKGSYRNTANTHVEVYLYLYSGNDRLAIDTVTTDYNMELGGRPLVGVISTKPQKLKKDQVIELMYGNNGKGNEETHSFEFGWPGDFISLLRVP